MVEPSKDVKAAGEQPPKPTKENIAYDVERPIYEKGPNWDFLEYKKFMLEKKEAKELPELHFFKANEDVSKYRDS